MVVLVDEIISIDDVVFSRAHAVPSLFQTVSVFRC